MRRFDSCPGHCEAPAFGLTCAVDVVITLNGRSRTVRTAWHYESRGPRLG